MSKQLPHLHTSSSKIIIQQQKKDLQNILLTYQPTQFAHLFGYFSYKSFIIYTFAGHWIFQFWSDWEWRGWLSGLSVLPDQMYACWPIWLYLQPTPPERLYHRSLMEEQHMPDGHPIIY